MKIAMLHGPRDLRIEEHPLDTNLSPTQVHVQTQVSAFKIGTDRGNYEGAEPVAGAPDYPRWVGDSNLGIVVATGEQVTGLSIGDRVVSRQPHQSEYVAEESQGLVRVPVGVSSEDAVWSHLYTLSAFCYRKAHYVPGEAVAVVGLGVLGLGAVALAPYLGARVVGIGNHETRLQMARDIGADAAFMWDDEDLQEKLNDFTGGIGIDLVILTANPWPAWRTACQIVRPEGRVSVVALPGRGEPPLDFNPVSMDWFYGKGISLIAVSGQAADQYPARSGDRFDAVRTCEHTLGWMQRGLAPSRLITHRLPFERMAEAYEMAYEREKTMLGVIFQW
ncbi:MAG: zinc-binding dehydrogenase [Gemmatimonadetes bacterium]|jgi:threonine dehydrogenase-like Zn-dependent dehydrogenase|nr:zinc-binding dehydrogenase [Gemmatimonadota bacterium]MBT5059167.1 zinc-binding dehydrogenase [Gemmatimonadota bacterium]MBT5144164.1 zinc-binding dehydrogenase [Gemmatimonadota bacterium]MBT5586636.1 zinc-binding dehydrogenase [Gemmatimonadota bacterium]MBT5964472.1 zinc-binding dehydrogenase [Gemmatimonadota bacterium]